jgi:hypothetical protein
MWDGPASANIRGIRLGAISAFEKLIVSKRLPSFFPSPKINDLERVKRRGFLNAPEMRIRARHFKNAWRFIDKRAET